MWRAVTGSKGFVFALWVLMSSCAQGRRYVPGDGSTDSRGQGPEVDGNDSGSDLNGDAIASDTRGCEEATCSCPSTFQCVPAVPPGWLGPVAADLSGQNTECSPGYPIAISAGLNPQGSPATCSCSCGACSGGACDVYYDQFSTSDCSGAPNGSHLIGSSLDDCNAITPNGYQYAIRGQASTTGASCDVTTRSVDIVSPSWGTNTRLCTGVSALAGLCSGDNVCVPLAGSEKTCVYHAGVVDCPSAYPAASIRYTGFEDDRNCTCACKPTEVKCSPTVSFIDTTGGCKSDAGSSFGECEGIFQGSTHGFRITALNVSVSGTTSSTPSGNVTAASPITICCLN